MSILVVGSVAYDSIKTPFGARENALGGSATHFSFAASYFAPVSIVAVVGEDFKDADRNLLESHSINTRGLAKVPGATFRWKGEYSDNLNDARTLCTELNVLADFQPQLSNEDKANPFLFLANIHPELQLKVLEQMTERPKLVAGDTMNFWIEGEPSTLSQVVAAVDVLLINEGEARQLTNETNVVKAARHILDQGPSMVVIKRGEYGALGFSSDGVFSAPAYPLETVVDPTGAGDSFAGGFMGHLASSGDTTMRGYRKAMIVGSVMASFAVESFSVDRLRALTSIEVKQRFQELWKIAHFDELDSNEVLAHHLA
ncbi:MAG: sugar kinase [SAR202 cluster bacterium Io17-Chloro-G3]|nr:MAG: sugar kinase [SAR202 cluster bacterium Io17-Chloro-G3]